MPELLTGEELEVYGDAGYLGAEKREEAITHTQMETKSITKLIEDLLKAKIIVTLPELKLEESNVINHL